MFNAQRPKLEDLPTNGQLLRATAGAIVAAGVILVTIVLPSEYAIYPTGIGRALGLTQMGEIKAQLAQEAALDATADNASALRQADAAAQRAAAGGAAMAAIRKDTSTVTLAPGEAAELKVTATKGTSVDFSWSVAGGRVNYDTHGDPVNPPANFYHGYGKGKDSAGQQGNLVAAFDGKHGWYWRNRSAGPVTITLKTEGAYSDVRRLL